MGERKIGGKCRKQGIYLFTKFMHCPELLNLLIRHREQCSLWQLRKRISLDQLRRISSRR